jgi:hypothetical protein
MRNLRTLAVNALFETLLVFSLVLFSHVNQSLSAVSSTNLNAGVSEAELAKTMRKGMSKQELEKIFGKPLREEVHTNGMVNLLYFWPVPSSPKASADSIGGVSVQLSNGLSVSWDPIHARIDPAVGVSGGNTNSYSTDVRIAFYVVSDESGSGRTFVNTLKLPNLGYVDRSPGLQVEHLQAITVEVFPTIRSDTGSVLSEDASQSKARLSVVLMPRDAKRLEVLTDENVGKRMLIMLDGEPLAAPLLMQAIRTGELQISFPDTRTAADIDRRLRPLTK